MTPIPCSPCCATTQVVDVPGTDGATGAVGPAGPAGPAGGAATVALALSATPTGTTNTTGVMMGLAGSITPVSTGRILVIVTGMMGNGTIADGAATQIRYGTGGAPSNGGALAGTTLGLLKTMIASTALGKQGFALSYVVSGLTLSTTYWVDISLAAVTAGTATVYGVDLVVIEL